MDREPHCIPHKASPYQSIERDQVGLEFRYIGDLLEGEGAHPLRTLDPNRHFSNAVDPHRTRAGDRVAGNPSEGLWVEPCKVVAHVAIGS